MNNFVTLLFTVGQQKIVRGKCRCSRFLSSFQGCVGRDLESPVPPTTQASTPLLPAPHAASSLFKCCALAGSKKGVVQARLGLPHPPASHPPVSHRTPKMQDKAVL